MNNWSRQLPCPRAQSSAGQGLGSSTVTISGEVEREGLRSADT